MTPIGIKGSPAGSGSETPVRAHRNGQALFAIVNWIHVAAGNATLSSTGNLVYPVANGNYSLSVHDITSGTNGSCGTLCSATTGYDYVTGLGSLQANNITAALANF
jgi:hypothetical protein